MYTIEQQNIIHEALSMVRQGASAPQWALVTDASAGTGKTHTIDGIINALDGNLKILATSFTNEAVNNLQHKFNKNHRAFNWQVDKSYSSVAKDAVMTPNGVVGCTATVNTLGFAILKEQLQTADMPDDLKPVGIDGAIVPVKQEFYCRVNGDKLYEIIKHYLKTYQPQIANWTEKAELTSQMMDVIRLVRADLMDYNDIDKILEVARDLRGEVKARETVEWAMQCLKVAIVYALRYGVIDFDEQIYLPNILNLRPSVQFDVVFLDELQNQSFGRLQIVLKYLKPGGTFIGMGDEKQEIMGFAGVTIGSFSNTVKYLDAKLMRLSESFRFGQHIAEQSHDIVPDLKGVNKNSADKVYEVADFPRQFESNSAVVCRSNAQCVEYMIALHNWGISTRLAKPKHAQIIEEAFSEIIDDIAKGQNGYIAEDLADEIEERMMQMHRAYQRFASPNRLRKLVTDHNMAKKIVQGFPNITQIDTLKNTVSALLSSYNGVSFITAHSSQGLEWEHTYVVRSDYQVSISASKINATLNPARSWMIVEEQQVFYVAKTRARQTMTLIDFPMCGYSSDSCEP